MSYLSFEPQTRHPGRKTDRWYVMQPGHRIALGQIMWYPPWRRYVFHPASLTLFDAACLGEIQAFLAKTMAEYKEGKEVKSHGEHARPERDV